RPVRSSRSTPWASAAKFPDLVYEGGMSGEGPQITPEQLVSVTRILETVADDSLLLSQLSQEDRIRLLIAAGRVIRPERDEVRRRLRSQRRAKWDAKRAADKALRAATT